MAYEYLVASLPMLFPGDPPPFSVESFRLQCRGLLSERDAEMLDRVLDGRAGPEDPAPVRDWVRVDRQVRNASAEARAGSWQADARPFLRAHPGLDVAIREAVEDAFSKSSPLDRERALDRVRWQALEDLARSDPFGRAAVVAYGLKLRIAERWAAWSAEAGRAERDRLLDRAVRSENEKAST